VTVECGMAHMERGSEAESVLVRELVLELVWVLVLTPMVSLPLVLVLLLGVWMMNC